MLRHDDVAEQLETVLTAGFVQMSDEDFLSPYVYEAGQASKATEGDKPRGSEIIEMAEFGHGSRVIGEPSHSKLWGTSTGWFPGKGGHGLLVRDLNLVFPRFR